MAKKIKPTKRATTPRQRGVRVGKKMADAYAANPQAYVKRTRLQREIP